MDHTRFDHWKTQTFKPDGVYYEWFIRDKKTKNGSHFHGRVSKFDTDPGFNDANQFGFWPMGIEVHSTTKRYDFQSPILNCRVTGGDCYCDGTSLGAQERLGDVRPDGRDDEWIWIELYSFYNSYFETSKGEDNDPTT